MQRAWSSWAMALALAATQANAEPWCGPTGVAGPVAAFQVSAAHGKQSEYGIALAMTGEYQEAENVFVSVLAGSPGDPRALTNLGNLRVLSGDLEVALAFYDQALRRAPNEAGIVLDRATAFMLLGEVERAEAEAARGVELAGGEAAAERLLGLPSENPDPSQRASNKVYLSPQEMRALLQAAARRVPRDTMKPGVAADSLRTNSKARRPARTWRSAGSRASDGGDVAQVLYWKK